MIKKNPRADLRSSYPITFQFGIICSLLFFIAATNIEIVTTNDDTLPGPRKIEDTHIVEIPPNIPQKKPAPHKPTVFNVLPIDSPIEPGNIEFGPLDFGSPLPPPPEKLPEKEIVEFVEIMPEMKGGVSKLYSEINYPKRARELDIEGRVIIQYVVNENGEVENPRIIRGIGFGCDEEVLKAIKLMKFTPGIQNGRFVKVKLSQVVMFKLRN